MDGAPSRLILFDCDGTLVDSVGHIHRTLCLGMASAGLTAPDPAAVRALIGLPLSEVIARLAPEAAAADIAAAARGYLAAFQHGGAEGSLFEGVAGTLAVMSSGAILGIATGKSRAGLRRVLDHHGIGGHFSVLKTADDGPGKPAPQIVLDAVAETGASAATTCVVGDTVFDMQMAYNAGVRAIGVAWGYHAAEDLRAAGAAAIAERFSDIPALVGPLTGGRDRMGVG